MPDQVQEWTPDSQPQEWTPDVKKSWWESLSDSTTKFLHEHPQGRQALQRLLSGQSPEDKQAALEHFKSKGYTQEQAQSMSTPIGAPTDTSILPTMQHPAGEGWPGHIARGLYNQVIRPLGSPAGFLGAASPGEAPETAINEVPKPAEVPETAPEASATPETKPEVPVEAAKPEIPEWKPDEAISELSTKQPDAKVSALEKVIHNAHPNGNSPPLDTIKAVAEKTPPGLPPPGGARDINAATAMSGSADQILENRPDTAGVVKAIRDGGFDQRQKFIGTNIRTLDSITTGLNKQQLEAFGRTAENVATDADNSLLSNIPNLKDRLDTYRALMDNIFLKASIARKGDLGYIDDYVTHIAKMPEDDIKSTLEQIFNYRQGKDALGKLFERKSLAKEGTDEAAGIFDSSMGRVSPSKFTEERTNALENIDYNVNKLGRAYIESMGREIYDRPAVDAAKKIIAKLPDSNVKELSEWYVKNFTGYDAAPGLHGAYKAVTNALLRTSARTLLGFNPHLQELHAMRLGPVWAELGTGYFKDGLAALVKNPAAAYREAASVGLLPQEIMPYKFQTVNEKIDSLLNFKSAVDFIDRSIAYNGFKSKFVDAGMNEARAAEEALKQTKKVTFTVDPSRATMGLNPDYSPGGSMFRLMAQYKQIPSKIAEYIVRTAAEAKQNPVKAARMGLLIGGSTASAAAGGPNLFHLPTSLGDWSASSLNEMRTIWSLAHKGDEFGALKELGLWLTPGGKSLQRTAKQLKFIE